MIKTKEAYKLWSGTYDLNKNKTRDLEKEVLKKQLAGRRFKNCLEIGSGTGKNTEFLLSICELITCVDISPEMHAIAKQKFTEIENLKFEISDINSEWSFGDSFELITFSLVLEHIQNLEDIFKKAHLALEENGILYIGELHPFKFYTGSQARFELNNETILVESYKHHLSEYINSAIKAGFKILNVDEHFDEENELPRILSLLLKKD